MGQELERQGVEGEDFIIERKGGREIVVPIRKSPDEPYSENPQVRAYQLVHEGRIGGNRNGGSGGRKKRISAAVVEEAQERLQPKIIRVIERGLRQSAGVKQNLATVKLITDMEHHEASLALKEEEIDLANADRSELIGTLRALLEDPQTTAALEGSVIDGTFEDITEAIEVEDPVSPADARPGREDHLPEGSSRNGAGEGIPAQGTGSTRGHAGEAQEDAPDAGTIDVNGHPSASSDRPKRRNPWVEAAKGGAGD